MFSQQSEKKTEQQSVWVAGRLRKMVGGAKVAAVAENQIKSDSKRSPEEACGQRAADDNKHSLSSLQSTFHLPALLVVFFSSAPPPSLLLLFLRE